VRSARVSSDSADGAEGKRIPWFLSGNGVGRTLCIRGPIKSSPGRENKRTRTGKA
jgi:hypothetical protein